MANVKINAEKLPVLFGEKNRPSEIVTNKADLQLEGQDFQSYSPKAGYVYRFPSFEDSIIKKQPVEAGSKNMQFLIGCLSSPDGKTFTEDWFSLNHLAKRDADNNAVHPTWRALGNVYKRAERLCELGELKVGTKARSIKQVVFQGGKPVKVPKRNDDGQIAVDSDGEPVMINKTEPRDVFDITEA